MLIHFAPLIGLRTAVDCAITHWPERHPYSANRIYQPLCADEGYTGGREHRAGLCARRQPGSPPRLHQAGRSVARRIQSARFPVIKTHDTFRWNWPKQINRLNIQNLFQLQFVEDRAPLAAHPR